MGAPTHRGIVRLLRFFSCCTLLIAAETAFAAFSMIEIISPSLGTFFGGVSGRNFILNTDGTITGTDAADYMLGAIGGELELKKTGGPVSANIVAENISTYGGLSVASVLCKYQNQAQTTCSGSGINVSLKGKRKLLLGINVTTTQFHGGGDTAGASMDITVTFL
jgi:hypothetical protein